jgi:alanyl-tRNA synthetase
MIFYEFMSSGMSKKDYHAPMHTVEHILNQAMDRAFGCGRCINAHIERRKSKCDYRFARPLSEEETRAIEALVNRIIRQDLPVTEEFVTRQTAERQFFTGRLPPDAGERIRIVRIGDYDACPCIGPHVSSTGEIAGFRIVSSSYENGVLRVRFTQRSAADTT